MFTVHNSRTCPHMHNSSCRLAYHNGRAPRVQMAWNYPRSYCNSGDGSGCEPSDESEESYSSGDDDFYTDHLTPMNTHSRATHSDHPDLLTADQKAAKTLKFRQNRLLMAYHATLCKLPPPCSQDLNCARMKEVMQHCRRCKMTMCSGPHCASTKFVLNHAYICRDNHCKICAPLRKESRRRKIVFEHNKKVARQRII